MPGYPIALPRNPWIVNQVSKDIERTIDRPGRLDHPMRPLGCLDRTAVFPGPDDGQVPRRVDGIRVNLTIRVGVSIRPIANQITQRGHGFRLVLKIVEPNQDERSISTDA